MKNEERSLEGVSERVAFYQPVRLAPVQGTPGRRKYQARLVRAGRARSPSGEECPVEILAEALRRAVQRGQFERKAVFLDHAAGWENPSLERLVGVTAHTRFDLDGPDGAAVIGELHMFTTPLARAVCSLLDDILAQGEQAPDVGLSIVFYPRWESPLMDHGLAAPALTRRVVEIRQVESVDLVFQPAADGRVLAALSAAAAQHAAQSNFYLRKENETMPEELLSIQSDDFEPGDAAAGARSEPAGEWLAAIAAAGTETLLEASDLPLASRQRLHSQLSHASGVIGRNQPLSARDVQAAIEAERSYLAALQQDNVIQIGGVAPRSPQVSGMRSEVDRISLALDALVAGMRPPDGIQPLTGIREAYHLLSGDYEMSGLYHPERVMFANVNSSTMAALVANALNKRLVNEFQQYPQWWAPIVTVEDFTTLQDIRWITLGGVGELPTVAEGAAYTELNWDDKTETTSFVKKGGYLGISLESIDKDDTGRLRAAPRALAQAAWLTLSKAIANIFTSNSGVGPNVSDNTALFTSAHGNLGSAALNAGAFGTVGQAMRKQTELNSGERLGALTAPRYLLVPPDLEITALQALASEYDYSYTAANAPAAPANPLAEGDSLGARMNAARSRVIVVDLWTDTKSWAAVADPRLYPTIGLGFRYGRTPEIFSVASPTAGLMFSNDTMPVKARFFFAVGPTDWKGLYKANVA